MRWALSIPHAIYLWSVPTRLAGSLCITNVIKLPLISYLYNIFDSPQSSLTVYERVTTTTITTTTGVQTRNRNQKVSRRCHGLLRKKVKSFFSAAYPQVPPSVPSPFQHSCYPLPIADENSFNFCFFLVYFVYHKRNLMFILLSLCRFAGSARGSDWDHLILYYFVCFW